MTRPIAARRPTPDARDADGNPTGYLENGLAARLQAP